MNKFEIPSCITISPDTGKIFVETAVSTAEIYLRGAHVMAFQKKGDAPLLFASEAMRDDHGKIIHGGIPICFPWFGVGPTFAIRNGDLLQYTQSQNAFSKPLRIKNMPRLFKNHFETESLQNLIHPNCESRPHEEKKLSHGFARNSDWELVETKLISAEAVLLRFELPQETMTFAGWPPVKAQLVVTISSELTLELIVTNTTEHEFIFEDCFHAYFFIGDISKATISGLKNLDYLDKVEDLARKQEMSDAIPIVGETNRIYLKSTGAIEINDRALQRLIRIEKSDSLSTVVWNPWIQKSTSWPDLQDDDYQKFLCVESGNVAESRKNLPPGAISSMKVAWSTSCAKKDFRG